MNKYKSFVLLTSLLLILSCKDNGGTSGSRLTGNDLDRNTVTGSAKEYDGLESYPPDDSEDDVSTAHIKLNGHSLNPTPIRVGIHWRSKRLHYAPLVRRIGKRYGLEEEMIHAIISQESQYRPTIGSPAGAVGMMQLLDTTGRKWGCAVRTNAECNIRAGTKFLKWMAGRYKGNIQTMAAGYNAGYGVSDSYLSGRKMSGKNPKGRKTPNGVPVPSFGYSKKQKGFCNGANVNPHPKCEGETYHYVRKVSGFYLLYKRNPKLIGKVAVKSPALEQAKRNLIQGGN